MPMYRYECHECDKEFSVLEFAGDPPAKVCNCEKQSKKIERILGVPSLSFKGKGFYVNDNSKRSSSTNDKKSGSDTSTTSTKSTDKKSSDSKTKTASTKTKKSTGDTKKS